MVDKIKRINVLSAKPMAIFVVFLVIFFFGVVVVQVTFDNAETIDRTEIFATENITLGVNTNATLTNTPFSNITALHKNTTWLEFDGVNNNITIADDTSLDIDSNISISVWFKTNSTLSTQYLLSKGLGTYSIEILKNGNITIGRDGLQVIHSTNKSSYQPNVWTHLVFTRNGTAMRIYVNNTLPEQANLSSVLFSISNKPLVIGRGLGTDLWNGSIDEVRIYNRSLSPTEISEIYLSRRIVNRSLTTIGLILWFPMNEGSGTDVNDLGNLSSNNGTRFGATWNNDGINISMTNTVEYLFTGNQFRLTDGNLSFTQIETNYSYFTFPQRNSTLVLRLTGVFIGLALIFFLLIPVIQFIRRHW